jgi:hypothetical protein
MNNKLTFSCFGFHSTEVFIENGHRVDQIGYLTEEFVGRGHPDVLKFHPQYDDRRFKTVPTEEEIVAEYLKQYKEKGVSLNKEIVYAG